MPCTNASYAANAPSEFTRLVVELLHVTGRAWCSGTPSATDNGGQRRRRATDGDEGATGKRRGQGDTGGPRSEGTSAKADRDKTGSGRQGQGRSSGRGFGVGTRARHQGSGRRFRVGSRGRRREPRRVRVRIRKEKNRSAFSLTKNEIKKLQGGSSLSLA